MSTAGAARPFPPRTAGVTAAADAVRRLLLAASVAVTALALLGHGGIDVGTRLSLATSTASTGSTAPGSAVRSSTGGVRVAAAALRAASGRSAAESKAPASSSALRPALAAALAVGSSVDVAPPGAAPRVAPHLVSRPVARPPSTTYLPDLRRGSPSRAPPGAAGT